METELKLAIAGKDIPALKSHPLLADYAEGTPQEQHQSDVYYDTAERTLRRHGCGLRVRSVGGRHIQTLKDAGSAMGGLHVRGEWEATLPDAHPDRAMLAGRFRHPDQLGDLLPLFTNTTTRTTWNLRLPHGAQIECVLDVGAIRAGKHQAGIAEVELELKQGDPADLFGLALQLNATLALRIENGNKAERGYALLDGPRPPTPAKAGPLHLPRHLPLEKAFQRIMANCLEQMEANVPGVLAHDAECLHQMRVGLRRLRAALKLFDKLAPLPDELAGELAWLSGLLGAARDWDVFITATLDHVGDSGWDAQREALRAAAREHAARRHKDVHAALRSRRYTHLVLALSAWVIGCQWRGQDNPLPGEHFSRNVRDGMRPLLSGAQRRLRKRLRRVDRGDAESRHHVRIAAKKYRYTAEFFASLLPAGPLKKHVRRLTVLQDMLGDLNDIAIAGRLLDQLARDGGPAQEPAGYARGYLAALARRRVKKLRQPIRRMEKLPALRA